MPTPSCWPFCFAKIICSLLSRQASDKLLHVHTLLLALSAILAVCSYVSLIGGILKGSIRPHPVTRLALCAALTLSFVGVLLADGNTGDLTITGIYAFLAIVALVLSFKRVSSYTLRSLLWGEAYPGRWLDRTCLSISLVGAGAFAVSGQSMFGIGCAIVADIAAYTPTVIKSWSDPASEQHWTYSVSMLSALAALWADAHIQWSSAFTIYLVFIDGLMVTLIYRQRLTAFGCRLWLMVRPKREPLPVED